MHSANALVDLCTTQVLTTNAQSINLFRHLSAHALRVHPFAHAGPHCIHPLNGNVQEVALSSTSPWLLAPSLPHSQPLLTHVLAHPD